jgi:hypothetical protein
VTLVASVAVSMLPAPVAAVALPTPTTTVARPALPALPALSGAPGLPVGGAPGGVDQTCELTATRFDPDTVNVLYPDSSAQYWTATFAAVPGTRIRIDGVFPYARYTSWNVYDPLLRPFAKASDYQLEPDPGSANPFIPGAARNTPAARRHYTLYLTFSPTDHPGPNTIYVDPVQHPTGLLTLRVYEPDRGRDAAGGVGLPQITWEATSASEAPSLNSPCRQLEKPTSTEVTGAYAGESGPSLGAPYPGRNPPDWHKFVNICQSGADLLLANAFGDQVPQTGQNPCGNFGSGGFLSNLDNAYVYGFVSRGFGPIVVFHAKAPTFAGTYPNASVMPAHVQLRYWSFCQNDPFSERYVACLRDDEVVRRSGDYTIVVSPPADWPAKAQRRCRDLTSWMPWGPQPQGVVLYRQMLPDPAFRQAIQNVAYGSERAQMGAYYPAGRYFADWRAVADAFCRK